MAGTIFINYRRGQNLKDAQHLATLLAKRFGDARIFLDVRGIDGGDNWLQTLEKQVAASDAMLALIGQNWTDIKDEKGERRLDNANDFVRFEIVQALQRNIPVLPVLLDGTPMPKVAQLPDSMWALLLSQAMPLRTESVVQDAEAIARRLKIITAKRQRGAPIWIMTAAVIAALMIGVLASTIADNQFDFSFLASSRPVLYRERLLAAKDATKKAEERYQLAVGDLDKAERGHDEISKKLNGRIGELDTQLAAANRDLTESKDLKARNADLQTELAAATRDRDTARAQLAEIGKRQVVSGGANDNIQDTLRLRQEVERTRAILAATQLGQDQARKDLASANAKISDLQKQLDIRTTEVVAARSGIQDEVLSGRARISELTNQLDVEKRMSSRALAQIELQNQQLAALRRQFAAFESALDLAESKNKGPVTPGPSKQVR